MVQRGMKSQRSRPLDTYEEAEEYAFNPGNAFSVSEKRRQIEGQREGIYEKNRLFIQKKLRKHRNYTGQAKKTIEESLRYDEDLQKLFWLRRPVEHFASEAIAAQWNGKFAGKVAGESASGEERKIGISVPGLDKPLAFNPSVIAWLLTYLQWPWRELVRKPGSSKGISPSNFYCTYPKESLSEYRRNHDGQNWQDQQYIKASKDRTALIKVEGHRAYYTIYSSWEEAMKNW